MSKVDWITWKTDPKEIINPDKIEEEIDEYFGNYDSYMNSMVYEQLKTEMSNGGLAKDAFNVSGISPSNEMAEEIVNLIDEIKDTMQKVKNNVREITTKQKEIEKRQLIDAIEEKIKKEKIYLDSIENRKGLKDTISKIGSNPDDILSIINDRIRKLTERLEAAKSL